MEYYQKPNPTLWKGRKSNGNQYLHEKIICQRFDELQAIDPERQRSFALLGYACDEGVRRNLGRTGAQDGPDHIRKMLAKTANHLDDQTQIIDTGDIICPDHNLENAQEELSKTVEKLLDLGQFPVLLGGGHDIAYGHYRGIKSFLNQKRPGQSIGIINMDAHFDLRLTENGANSGTPFYQIARESEPGKFHYLALGIQRHSNARSLFETAESVGANYILNEDLTQWSFEKASQVIEDFLAKVDKIYLSVDLDGFSSSIAPGVSAPSPFGITIEIGMEIIKLIGRSEKLISIDIAEINPVYDTDDRTARLAAGLINFIISNSH